MIFWIIGVILWVWLHQTAHLHSLFVLFCFDAKRHQKKNKYESIAEQLVSRTNLFVLWKNTHITRTVFLRVVWRSVSCPRPLCLTHWIDQSGLFSKRLMVFLCATRTVRSLHPTHFQSNGPKHLFFFGNCLCCCLIHFYLATHKNLRIIFERDHNNLMMY